MAVFTPPTQVPQIVTYAAPRYGAVPAVFQSHGFTYVVRGNTLLAPALIQRALQHAATPPKALEALLQSYYRQGYTLVAVTGQVAHKTVEITVFQGMFVEIRAPAGLAGYFTTLAAREDVKNAAVIRAQILAGSYAGRSGRTISVNLSPAPNPGGAVLTVTSAALADYFPVSGSFNFGNYGSRFSSGYIAAGNAVANLTHGVQISYSFMRGLAGLRSESFGSDYYQNATAASIVTRYGIYGINASWTHFRLGQLTAPLFPDGNILVLQLSGTQLLYADTAAKVTMDESLNRAKFRETLLNGLVTVADQQYDYLSWGGRGEQRVEAAGLGGSLSMALTLNIGVSPAAGSLADGRPGVPTSHFKYAQLSLAYQQTLPRGFQASLSGQAQAADSTLPFQQQWVLGGPGSLAAWEPGVVAGDGGYAARLEMDAPAFMRLRSILSPAAFLEVAAASLRTPAAGTAPWQLLADAGLSLKLQLPHRFTATAMTALPMVESGFSAAGRHELALNRLDAFFVVQKDF